MEDKNETIEDKINDNNKLTKTKNSNEDEKKNHKIVAHTITDNNEESQEGKFEKKYFNRNINKERNQHAISNYNSKSKIPGESNINNSINYNDNQNDIGKIIYIPFYQLSMYYKEKCPNPYEYYFFNPDIYNKNTSQRNISYNSSININIKNDINILENDRKIAKFSLELVKTKSGCDVLLQKSINNHFFANELLFPEIINHLKEICCSNIWSSFLMSSLLDIMTYENIDSFLSFTKDNFYDICLTETGSRVIQKLLERIAEFPLLLNKFIFNITSKNIGILINSIYGNYIFRKYLSLIKNEQYINFIYDFIFKNFNKITKEKYGICVVMNAFSESNDNKKKIMMKYILNNFKIIIKNCYGNYLIKFLLLNKNIIDFEEIMALIKKIEENIVDYCKSPYSSSVIEKCLEKSEQKFSEHMIRYLLEHNLNSLNDIIKNSFGVYIIIKALKINNLQIKEKILKYIVKNLEQHKILTNINKIIFSLSVEDRKYFDILYKDYKGI